MDPQDGDGDDEARQMALYKQLIFDFIYNEGDNKKNKKKDTKNTTDVIWTEVTQSNEVTKLLKKIATSSISMEITRCFKNKHDEDTTSCYLAIIDGECVCPTQPDDVVIHDKNTGVLLIDSSTVLKFCFDPKCQSEQMEVGKLKTYITMKELRFLFPSLAVSKKLLLDFICFEYDAVGPQPLEPPEWTQLTEKTTTLNFTQVVEIIKKINSQHPLYSKLLIRYFKNNRNAMNSCYLALMDDEVPCPFHETTDFNSSQNVKVLLVGPKKVETYCCNPECNSLPVFCGNPLDYISMKELKILFSPSDFAYGDYQELLKDYTDMKSGVERKPNDDLAVVVKENIKKRKANTTAKKRTTKPTKQAKITSIFPSSSKHETFSTGQEEGEKDIDPTDLARLVQTQRDTIKGLSKKLVVLNEALEYKDFMLKKILGDGRTLGVARMCPVICSYCKNSQVDTIFMPCCHMIACSVCFPAGSACITNDQVCIVCKSHVFSTIQINTKYQ